MLFTKPGLHTEPIAFAQAAAYVDAYHRHNDPPVGHIFSVGCYYNGRLVGVAMCGRPVGRKLDNGTVLEVYRVCARAVASPSKWSASRWPTSRWNSGRKLGHKNTCSKLYAACIKYARLRGYAQVITYTLHSETAASVRAANFTLAAEKAGGKEWNGRTGYCGTPEYKRRWAYQLK